MAASGLTRAVALPLLVLLHLAFSLFSLLLRITQSFSKSSATVLQITTPQHVALCLPIRTTRRSGSTSGPGRLGAESKERRALVESIRRAVRWAGEDGVKELSVYSNLGWEGVPEELQRVSNSPISSREPSVSSHTSMTPPDSLSVSSSASEDEAATVHGHGHGSSESMNSTPSPTPRGTGTRRRTLPVKAPNSPAIKLTLSPTKSKSVKLHLLPELDLTSVTMKYAQSGTPPSQITVQSVDTDLRNLLGIESDPDVLIIHPLTPLNPLRALLPRPAPELSSYPFWFLRITEIYQCPQPLPFTMLLAPVVHRLRASTLPALVKIGFAMPLVNRDKVRGALRREEWDGAMAALCKVEQRLGK